MRKENILITYSITNEAFILLLKMSNTITIDLNIFIINEKYLLPMCCQSKTYHYKKNDMFFVINISHNKPP